ncbi:hypothetical protein [Croceicoccus sp. BE223]|uniref:hypothetical protein n=1 Tax=Croceicoccus sp. BE223 TaxID=2817716 RepID=UPI002863AB04|nr:hypothetical protein [Croceicoccus sp. BE223]MDR7102889.1 hypothetical protein [Croceicoccus sp. BE223]
MHKYLLTVARQGAGDEQIFEFESQDTAGALTVLSTMYVGPCAEPWEDNNFICTIERDAVGPDVGEVRAPERIQGRMPF